MNVRPLLLQLFRMPRDELLSSLDIPVGNRSHDLGGCMRREIDGEPPRSSAAAGERCPAG